MKLKFGLSSVAIVAVCGTMQILAQTTTHGDQSLNRDKNQNGQYPLGKLEKASKIIGMEIKDAQNEKLGKIEDLAVDLHNGRIVEVIVGSGGVFGVSEQLTAVPPGQFTCDPEHKALELNVDKAHFKEAPSFKMAEWESKVDAANVTQVYQYYGAQPYFTNANVQVRTETAATTTPNHPAELQEAAARPNPVNPENTQPCHLGEVQRADKVIGTSVRNMQNDKIGTVDNLMVDLSAGRVVEVIVASGGFLGLGDELSTVPPQAFHTGPEKNTLALDTTKEALANAPHFKRAEWSDVNNSDQVSAVYRSYNVEPYFSTNAADNTAQNARDRSDSTLTPLNQGTSSADVETTRQIRQQIMAADGFSVNARNVKIITIDGRVTLRGTVNTQEEKRRIGDIAAKIVTPANVNNQLQVAQLSSENSTQ